VLDFDVGEEGGIAEVGLAAGTDVVAVVGLVPPPSSTSALLKGVLQTGGKHSIYNYTNHVPFHMPSPKPMVTPTSGQPHPLSEQMPCWT
jgi:hypothetical protein